MDRNKITMRFREDILALDDTYGFIEREEAIDGFLQKKHSPLQAVAYADAFAGLMDSLSTPVREYDLLLGAMIQGPIPYEMELVAGDGYSHAGNPFAVYDRCAGHCCPDYETLLQKGLRGLERDIEKAARKKRGKGPALFTASTQKCVSGIMRFARRYAEAARQQAAGEMEERRAGLEQAADALTQVPGKPARSFFEALQCVWFTHLLLSACAGGRDFGFGCLDRTLLPYYEADLREGRITEEQALGLLENFLLHCNELGGRVPVQVSYKEKPDYKPVPCASTKQYLVLGGVDETGKAAQNRLSELFLEAALRVKLLEPVFVIRLSAGDSTAWKHRVHDAAQRLQGQVTVFNDDIIVPRLEELGVPAARAAGYVMTGCNGVTFPGMQHTEIYHNAGAWLTGLLEQVRDETEFPTFVSFLEKFEETIDHHIKNAPAAARISPNALEDCRFHLESLFFTDCREAATDIENGGQRQEASVHFIAAAATVIDSLYAIDTLVYRQKRLTVPQLQNILWKNFAGEEPLLQDIRGMLPKFGNDNAVDRYAALFSGFCHDAIEKRNREEANRLHSGGFYGLYWQYKYGAALPATPDGRLCGEPVSENMSPGYGNDVSGVTAMLKSVAAMGLRRSTTGGLNVKFTKYMPLPACTALFDAFFALGGINYAVTLADRRTLEDAKAHPEKHRNLCVRITGYSEYFTRLPDFVQDEIIRRTPAN